MSRHVEASLLTAEGFGNRRERQPRRRHCEGYGDGEDAAPPEPVHESAAERRADRESQPVAAGPDAECSSALFLRPRYADDRERGRNDERRSEAGGGPRADQPRHAGCSRARRAGERKQS